MGNKYTVLGNEGSEVDIFGTPFKPGETVILQEHVVAPLLASGKVKPFEEGTVATGDAATAPILKRYRVLGKEGETVELFPATEATADTEARGAVVEKVGEVVALSEEEAAQLVTDGKLTLEA